MRVEIFILELENVKSFFALTFHFRCPSRDQMAGYVTSFLVHSSNDNIKWMVYKDKESGKPKVITNFTESSHVFSFHPIFPCSLN